MTRGLRFLINLVTTLLLTATVASAHDTTSACNEQRPQDFLIRANMYRDKRLLKEALAKSLRYRVEQYGWVEPARKLKELNPTSAFSQLQPTYFMGLPVNLHGKIVPVIKCVENAIFARCDQPYLPRSLSGIRDRNTYRGGEVSNHMFGIALDIDPDRNPCCGCVPPWSDSPKCKKKAGPLERTELPSCWIETFEKFGFYWLGWDVMQDTMHFEFLGDPAKILSRP